MTSVSLEYLSKFQMVVLVLVMILVLNQMLPRLRLVLDHRLRLHHWYFPLWLYPNRTNIETFKYELCVRRIFWFFFFTSISSALSSPFFLFLRLYRSLESMLLSVLADEASLSSPSSSGASSSIGESVFFLYASCGLNSESSDFS